MFSERRRHGRRASSALTRLALYAHAAGILVAPQLIGGVYPWGMLIIAALGLLGFGLALASDPRSGLPVTPLALALLAALGWTALQACPLPCVVVDWLVPSSADALRKTHALLGMDEPRWCTLSHAPAATREEIVKAIAIIAFFATAVVLSRRGYRRWVLKAVVGSGTLLAIVALAHTALSAERLFGLYEPFEMRRQPLLAPIINLNTFGGLLAMCVPLAIALAFVETAPRVRFVLLVATGVMATTVLMTRSRGAVGALVVGVLLCVTLALFRAKPFKAGRGLSPRRKLERLAIPAGALGALAVAAYAWYEEVLAEFRAGGWDKFEVIADGARFALDHPVFGVGRGAFGSTFAAVRGGINRFDHAENFLVHWAAEWGLPLTVALCAALGHALLRTVRSTESLERLGALAGLFALGLQNLVDLGFELIGPMAVAAAALGAACTDRPTRGPTPTFGMPFLSRRALASSVAAIGALALAVLAVPVLRHHASDLERALSDHLLRRDRAGFGAVLARAMLAHPSEPRFAVLASAEALLHDDARVGRFINRGLQLAPEWATPHLQAAQWLFSKGRTKQAMLELGIAARIDPYGSRGLLCPVAAHDPEGVAAVAPTAAEQRRLFFVVVGEHCLRRHPAASARFDELTMRESPERAEPRLRDAQRKLERGDALGALAAADEILSRGIARHPDRAVYVKAKALIVLGRSNEALRLLRDWERRIPHAVELIELQAEIHTAAGDRSAMRQAVERLRGRAGGSATAVANVFRLEADLERKLGNEAAALHALEEAYRITGDSGALAGIARASERLGNRGRALEAYRQLCNSTGPTHSACERHAALLGQMSPESPDKAAQPSPR